MKITQLLPLAVLLIASGCDSEGNERPDPAAVRIFNAAPNFENLALIREQRVEAEVRFASGTSLSFDSGPYDFHLDHAVVGSTVPVRAVSRSVNLAANRDYVFIPVSSGGALQMLLVDTENDPDSETTSRVTFIHAHPAIASLDVYMVDADIVTGCELAGSQPRGRIAFGPSPLPFDLAPGTYRICLTTADNPADVQFASLNIPLPTPGTNLALIVYDEGGRRLSDVNVAALDSSATRLNEIGLPAQIRFLHDVDDGLARDFYLSDQTTPLLPAPLPAGTVSEYVQLGLAGGSQQVAVNIFTPGAGDPDGAAPAILAQQGVSYTALFAGDTTNGIAGTLMIEDPRSIIGQVTLRFVHTASLHDALEIFLRTPGTDITTVQPNAVMIIDPQDGAPQVMPRTAFAPGDFELTIRDAVTQTIVAGPELLSFEAGGVYTFVLLNDRIDPNRIDVRNLDDLGP